MIESKPESEFPTLQQFTALIDSPFTALTAQDTLVLRLSEANALSGGTPGRSEPFSLIFSGSIKARLTQGTYALEHRELPTLQIFLVPIGVSESEALYEAVFN